jgi:hypothetical protein
MSAQLDPDPDQLVPADEWARESAKRALDDLFENAQKFRTSGAYRELLEFTRRFRFYSPFNAMLVHVQMKGARYVAPAHRWIRDYDRDIRPGARPLVILQPMGPVMFVFDVADTEPRPGARRLPREVENPFGVLSGRIGNELNRTRENAIRDGIEVEEAVAGSQRAGSIQMAAPGKQLQHLVALKPKPAFATVPRRYYISLNRNQTTETRYATLAHELGHLYAGHLGTPNEKWWPDRRGLDLTTREFEAESICYLVCSRLGIDNPSDAYLSDYLNANTEIPHISLDCVMKAAGLIEQMGRERLKSRPTSGETKR